MSDAIIISLISAGTSLFAAIFSLLNNIMAKKNEAKMDEQTQHIKETSQSMVSLERNTDGIKDQLVKTVGQAEYAKGLKQGEENKS